MNKTFIKIGLSLLALAGIVWPSRGAVTGTKTLHGHVPAVVRSLKASGRLNATNILHLAIGLPLRDQASMNSLLQQIYDPSSPNYRSFLTPEEFTARFGPTVEDYQKVVDFARKNGLTVVGGSTNRTLVDVYGTVGEIERTFHVTMHSYQHPKESRNFYAPDTEPTVDSGLPILSVSGLNNYKLPKPLYHKKSGNGQTVNSFATGSAPGRNYWGYDFRKAYVPGTTLTGTGQKVALFECDGYFPSDVTSYLNASGLPTVPLLNVLIDGATGSPSGIGGEVEVALDIDMANSMAPGLSQIIVYMAPDDTPAFNLDQLNRIATDNLASQISSSWLIDDTPQFAQIYIQFALQGQSFFQASGDQDAYYPGIFQFEDSPLVTLVGGTTLTSTGPGGIWSSETVWNTGFNSGGGGGISLVYPIPYYQTNIDMSTNMGSTTMRNIPDVALTASDIWIWGDGFPGAIGGTSCAAPLWAGFMALANQQIVAAGKTPIGFMNPTIYALAQSTNFAYTNLFHDIVTGNNTNFVQTNLYFATIGYDLCTGWGTPNGTNLINAFTFTAKSNLPVGIAGLIPPPPQPWGNTLSVMNGTDPNGLWLLYFQDDAGVNTYSGTNYNGWLINLTTANPVGFAADNQLYVNSKVNNISYGNATNVPVPPGSIWQVTLAVTNYGPSVSSNVFVSNLLPTGPGINLISSSPTVGSISGFGPSLIWNVGNLPVNTGGALTLNLQASSTGVYANSATVSAATSDPNPDDDSINVIANVAVTIPPVIQPALKIGAGGAFKLSVTNDAGATIIVQASTNLVNWIPVYTNVAPFTFTNFDSTNYLDRFYRALISQ